MFVQVLTQQRIQAGQQNAAAVRAVCWGVCCGMPGFRLCVLVLRQQSDVGAIPALVWGSWQLMQKNMLDVQGFCLSSAVVRGAYCSFSARVSSCLGFVS